MGMSHLWRLTMRMVPYWRWMAKTKPLWRVMARVRLLWGPTVSLGSTPVARTNPLSRTIVRTPLRRPVAKVDPSGGQQQSVVPSGDCDGGTAPVRYTGTESLDSGATSDWSPWVGRLSSNWNTENGFVGRSAPNWKSLVGRSAPN